jgi:GT2 family glycosyltransferase
VNTTEITFIIPLFNHVEHSKAMLDSLFNTIPKDLDYEVILVDDGSSDGTRAWMEQVAGDRVRVLFNDRNLGYAKSNNRGAEIATGAILGLLNNDLILLDGWLEPMLAVLQSASIAAGIVGNIQFRADDDAVDHAGVEVNHLAKLGHIRSLSRPGVAMTRAFAVTGACCLVRRSDFMAVGGFDEQYVNSGEDIDLCLKLWARHRYAYVANTSRVRHHVSLSRGTTSNREEQNSRLLFHRWRPIIERETKNAWLQIFLSPTAADSSRVIDDFHLANTFRSAPHAVAGILAKSAYLREDKRWSEILDADYSHIQGLTADSIQGFSWDSVAPYPWINGCARFALPAGAATRNVVVTGRIFAGDGVEDCSPTDIEITLRINGVQSKTSSILAAGVFTIGIARPASVPRRPTLVTIALTAKSHGGPMGSCLPHVLFKACRFVSIAADDRVALDLGR